MDKLHDWFIGAILVAIASLGLAAFFSVIAGCAYGGDATVVTPIQQLRNAQQEREHIVPELHTWQCVSKVRGQFLFARPVNFHGVDLVLEAYDRDEDTKYDFALLYEYVGNSGELRPFPTRYISLVEGKSYEYVDMMGNGRCGDIRSVEGNSGEIAGDPVPEGGPQPKKGPVIEIPVEPEESCDMETPPTPDKDA